MSIQPVELYGRDAQSRVAAIATGSIASLIEGWDEPKQWAATECVAYLASGTPGTPILRTEPELKVAWLSDDEILVIHTKVINAVATLQQQGYFSN